MLVGELSLTAVIAAVVSLFAGIGMVARTKGSGALSFGLLGAVYAAAALLYFGEATGALPALVLSVRGIN